MKCNTWEGRKGDAILSVYAKELRKTKIPSRVPIDVRPKSVETRRYYGHWEGDSLISRKSPVALNSLTEIGLKCYFAHPYAS
jgi:IS30 family transposase